jgi:hypothetical protein
MGLLYLYLLPVAQMISISIITTVLTSNLACGFFKNFIINEMKQLLIMDEILSQ